MRAVITIKDFSELGRVSATVLTYAESFSLDFYAIENDEFDVDIVAYHPSGAYKTSTTIPKQEITHEFVGQLVYKMRQEAVKSFVGGEKSSDEPLDN